MKFGYIFDLDNTLINTECAKNYRKNRMFTEACSDEMLKQMTPATELIEYIHSLLDFGTPVAIVSNSVSIYGMRILDYIGLNDPRIIKIFYHDVKKHKPDKEPLLKAVSSMGYDIDNIICVGDEETDIQACYNASKSVTGQNYYAFVAAWFVGADRYVSDMYDGPQPYRICKDIKDFISVLSIFHLNCKYSSLRLRENNIYYFLDYYPTGKNRLSKHDYFSKTFVESVKIRDNKYKKESYKFEMCFFKSLINTLKEIGINITTTGFMIIPSSSMHKWNLILEKGIQNYIVAAGGIDLSRCIVRTQERDKQSQGGSRNYINNMKTLDLTSDISKVENIVILDDFVTTDSSMRACMELLFKKGYRGNIIGACIGATYGKNNAISFWYQFLKDQYISQNKSEKKQRTKLQTDAYDYLKIMWEKLKLENKKQKKHRECRTKFDTFRKYLLQFYAQNNQQSFNYDVSKKTFDLPQKDYDIFSKDWKFNIDIILGSENTLCEKYKELEEKYIAFNIYSIPYNKEQKEIDKYEIFMEAKQRKYTDNEYSNQLYLYAAECGISEAYYHIAYHKICDCNNSSLISQRRWIEEALHEGQDQICNFFDCLDYNVSKDSLLKRNNSFYRDCVFKNVNRATLIGLESENYFTLNEFSEHLKTINTNIKRKEKYYSCYIGRLQIGILTKILLIYPYLSERMIDLAIVFIEVFEDVVSFTYWIDKAIELGNLDAVLCKNLYAVKQKNHYQSYEYETRILEDLCYTYDPEEEYYLEPHQALETAISIQDSNPFKAHDLFLYASESGITDAYYYVAMNYKNGHGIDKNHSRYIEWLIESANNNDNSALLELKNQEPNIYQGLDDEFKKNYLTISDIYESDKGISLLQGIQLSDIEIINFAIVLFYSFRAKNVDSGKYEKPYISSLILALRLKLYNIIPSGECAFAIAKEYLVFFDDKKRYGYWLRKACELENYDAKLEIALNYYCGINGFSCDKSLYHDIIHQLLFDKHSDAISYDFAIKTLVEKQDNNEVFVPSHLVNNDNRIAIYLVIVLSYMSNIIQLISQKKTVKKILLLIFI